MSHSLGRTRWKLFAAIMVPGIAVATALGIGMAQGALAASFFISGRRFQLSTASLVGHGLSVYSTVDVTREGVLVPVVVTGLRSAVIRGLCESVVTPVPFLGPYTLRLTGADRLRRAEARDIFIDATALNATQQSAHDLNVGVAAGSITKGPVNPGDRHSRFFDPNGFAQQASTTFLANARWQAVAVSAVTLDVPDVRVRVLAGRHECF
ncbi:DUF6230 family protein [Streptantibioticus ferralitis]|uniref:DUF6230 family protein n=1 Tax=Streptantibioticus ferralitis TaxID=236510 RepID=A0ABT5YU12_9ACTN|nr:DUF6230 family protein [Streptantibioticus ferralitis]MDF2255096.1 DUF6230 family protein [Streptantibioticus ferralitis]